MLPMGPYWECPECGSKEIARWQAPLSADDERVICACFDCRGQWRSELPPLSEKMKELFLMAADALGGILLGESRDWIGVIAVPLRLTYPNSPASTGGYLLIYTDSVTEEKKIRSWQQADEELGAGAFREAWHSIAYRALRDGAREIHLSPLSELVRFLEDGK